MPREDQSILRPRHTRKGKKPKNEYQTLRPSARENREAKSAFIKAIEQALRGDASGGVLGAAVREASRGLSKAAINEARSLFRFFEDKHPEWIQGHRAARGLVRLCKYRSKWSADPRDCQLHGGDGVWLRELARYLIAQYPLPAWLMNAWDQDEPHVCDWYVIVAQGGSLATAKNLPFPLSKLAIHHAMSAPRGLTAVQALRWGQFRALGVPAELCDEVAHSRLALPQQDETFWRSVAQWLAVNPEVIGEVNVLIEYIHAQKFGDFGPAPQPRFAITGRSPDRLLHLALRYQHQLAGLERNIPVRWKSCGIVGYSHEHRQGHDVKMVQIVELTTGRELRDEGETLNHCVLTYAQQAAEGETAIYSLRKNLGNDLIPVATIEVWLGERKIVQARGQSNRLPDVQDQRVIRRWADAVGLAIAPMAMDYD